MDLYEYEAKQIFRAHGLPTSEGEVADHPAGARRAAERLGNQVVVKAQVKIGGRGKAGGIRVAASPAEAESAARDIIGMDIRGHKVAKVLVEPAVQFGQELYLGIVLDRSRRAAVMMASREGGMDIEEVAARSPHAIHKVEIDPLLGLRPFQARGLAFGIGLDARLVRPFAATAEALYDAFTAWEATLTEINPLVVTAPDSLLALDGKMTIDDSALGRLPDAAAMRDPGDDTTAEAEARAAGLSYVDLDGTIGCLVNGAGLAMATMDVIQHFGGRPANFLDIGGGAQADKVEAAMRIILRDSRVKSVLINIFGGITRGDEVARGLLAALEQIETSTPIVARIVGTNADEARALLDEAKLATGATLAEAAQKAIALAGAAT
jgi:succinyl-CoA synthetase beta subunit